MTAAECNSAVDRQQRHTIGGTGDIYQLYAQRTRCSKFTLEVVCSEFPVLSATSEDGGTRQ